MNDSILKKIKTVLNQTTVYATHETTNQNSMSDVKYQDITYYMHSREKTIQSNDHIHIDFFKALYEMNNLDWNYEKNYIGFENNRTNECVQFIRKEEDKWYADVPVMRGNWEGYVWYCYSDSKSVFDMMQLFFEEVIWFTMLDWKLRRINS